MQNRVIVVKSLVMGITLMVSPILYAQEILPENDQPAPDPEGAAITEPVQSYSIITKPEEVGRSSGPQLKYQSETVPAPPPAPEEPAAPEPPDVPAAPATAKVETLVLPEDKPYVEIDLARLQNGLDKARRRSYGGCGGLNPQLLFLDFEPLEDLVATDVSLKDKQFNFKDNAIFLWGGTGYAGLGHGMRVGGAGWGNLYHYYSEPFQGTDYDSSKGAYIDSVVELGVVPGFGGFTVEKAFSFNRLHLSVGGILGGGALVVIKQTCREDELSAFHGGNHTDNDTLEFDSNIEIAVAPFTLYGLQTGISYSLLKWMHVGLEGAVYMFHSLGGFGYGFDKFITVNPAVRFKIVFGNLG